MIKLELDMKEDRRVSFKTEHNKLAEYLNILRCGTLGRGEKSGKMRILRESSFFHSDVYLHCYSLEADAAGKTQTYFCKTSSASIRFFKASEQVPGGCEEKVSQQSVRFLSLPVF